ncbi:hypothetical protein ACQP4Q_09190 [Actinobacillus pleuropneumoniae]|uniref:hypothetical protein n=1 Tax=Actinobacillus pleuropneumoniae TaxID=715 RepID=UPI0001DF789C|nr:hypothetical protein [Actinobacillus pleuropneumoniae]EFL81190.1 hypothetical protein APP6_1380 [Actinobacillus pleuropneumoniae serovar 6 str. Femo]UKH12105.1 hypothetical protein D1099_09600 [Actinobacillus pleuropneumoniae serovar 6 str. Femo]UKH15230.1 hypothetical protein D1112_08965 [Actinobacillus pleuropneumoniae]UKH23402.1 hypothetical protein D1108_08945 [Actinobacillus pleuropneumoniae]UKH41944.1 hypothetical protein D1097_09365 [Actinobacillus pleuropneumoniae serovar 4 str. M62
MNNECISPISVYQSIIKSSFMLERNGSCYLIKEDKKNTSNRIFKIQVSKSIGFSLDKNGKRWDFFSDNLPKGIASVSDGIIFCEYRGEYYTIIIDMKSKNISNGISQVRSSIALCQWLNILIHVHKSSRGFRCKFIGLICKTGRNTPSKRGTRKGIDPDAVYKYDGHPIFTINNPGTISICDIIKWLSLV